MDQLTLRPGLADVPVAESAISFIDGKRARLEYRGIAVETLARESCFEETAWLLLKGELPTQARAGRFRRPAPPPSPHQVQAQGSDQVPARNRPSDGRPAGRRGRHGHVLSGPRRHQCPEQLGLGRSPDRQDADRRGRVSSPAPRRRGRSTPRDDLDHAANFYYMLFEREPSPAVRKVIDACLILHAEHTMNASTFSGRVTGSTLANPYTVISSAIGTLTGPLHGGANEEVLDMLDEIGSVDQRPGPGPRTPSTNKKKIMGFGHRVYKVKDPRATVLQELAEHVFAETGRPKQYDLAVELERVMAGLLGPQGHLSQRRFLFGHRLRVARHPRATCSRRSSPSRAWPAGCRTGWSSSRTTASIRPEQIYVGKHDVPYVPLEKRP